MSRVGKKQARKKKNPIGTILLLIVFALVMAGVIKVGLPLVRMYAGAVKEVSSSNEDTFRQW